jgi:hypothetical protein
MSEAKEDRLSSLVKRNRNAQIVLGLVGVGGGTTSAILGFVPPFGLIFGLVLIAMGAYTLVRNF